MIEWNKVTWYSKMVAIIFFIGALPIITFCIGVQYGEAVRAVMTYEQINEYVNIDKAQEIIIVSSTSTSVGSYALADFNFDGNKDRARLMGCGNVNCTYSIEFFDPTKNIFIQSKDNFEITNPEVNLKEKIVCSSNKGSASSYSYVIYKYKENSFVKVYNEEIELTEESTNKNKKRDYCTLE